MGTAAAIGAPRVQGISDTLSGATLPGSWSSRTSPAVLRHGRGRRRPHAPGPPPRGAGPAPARRAGPRHRLRARHGDGAGGRAGGPGRERARRRPGGRAAGPGPGRHRRPGQRRDPGDGRHRPRLRGRHVRRRRRQLGRPVHGTGVAAVGPAGVVRPVPAVRRAHLRAVPVVRRRPAGGGGAPPRPGPRRPAPRVRPGRHRPRAARRALRDPRRRPGRRSTPMAPGCSSRRWTRRRSPAWRPTSSPPSPPPTARSWPAISGFVCLHMGKRTAVGAGPHRLGGVVARRRCSWVSGARRCPRWRPRRASFP